jgi:predicted nucleotidyltransferase
MVMSLSDYIEAYDTIEQEDDIDKLKYMAKFILVGRAMCDRNLSEEEAIALAEYSSIDLGMAEEVIVH